MVVNGFEYIEWLILMTKYSCIHELFNNQLLQRVQLKCLGLWILIIQSEYGGGGVEFRGTLAGSILFFI